MSPVHDEVVVAYVVGGLIGILSWFAFATADKPLGITTAFEYAAALGIKAAVPAVEQTNAYFSDPEKNTEDRLGMDARANPSTLSMLGVLARALRALSNRQ